MLGWYLEGFGVAQDPTHPVSAVLSCCLWLTLSRDIKVKYGTTSTLLVLPACQVEYSESNFHCNRLNHPQSPWLSMFQEYREAY